MTIQLNNVASGYSTGVINDNFEKLEQYINQSLLNKDNVEMGEANQMETHLDMNGFTILNLATNPDSSESLVTKGFVEGEIGTLEALLDQEVEDRQNADANLQSQISGSTPLEASAFSPVSWHDQEISNSVTIPANKNGWSFGPSMTIASGQTVTISEGAFWTIANGEGDTLEASYDGGTL